jgi:hypothetical protein
MSEKQATRTRERGLNPYRLIRTIEHQSQRHSDNIYSWRLLMK